MNVEPAELVCRGQDSRSGRTCGGARALSSLLKVVRHLGHLAIGTALRLHGRS